MRHRAKCLRCTEIVESISSTDIAICTCQNVMITGGPDTPLYHIQDMKKCRIVEDDGAEKSIKTAPDVVVEENKPLSIAEQLDLLDTTVEKLSMSYPLDSVGVIESLTLASNLLRSCISRNCSIKELKDC
jgi:hypothetical protein